jgi:hypothetical protein
MLNIPIYELNGKRINLGSINLDELEGDSFFDEKSRIYRIFTDRKAFIDAAKTAEISNQIEDLVKKLEGERDKYSSFSEPQLSGIQLGQLDEIQLAQSTEFTAKQTMISDLLKNKGVNPKDPKALLALAKAGDFGCMMGYDGTYYHGLPMYFDGIYPALGWIGFNDRLSSLVNFLSVVTLHRASWFRGHRMWIKPLAFLPTLGYMDNRTSSIIVF